MNFDNDLVVGKLRRWEKFLAAYRLPDWDANSGFRPLYGAGRAASETVSGLSAAGTQAGGAHHGSGHQQLCPYKAAAGAAQKALLPHPYRVSHHDLYAQAKPAAVDATTLLPGDLPEEDVKRAYAAFVLRHQRCAKYFIEQVRLTAAAMFDREVTTELNVRDTPEMIVSAAI